MSINPDQPIFINDLPDKNVALTVKWYCGVRINQQASSEAKVTICFEDRSIPPPGNTYFYEIGITHLGLLQIGSVWKGKRRIGIRTDFEEKVFTISGADNEWSFVKPWDSDGSGKPLIPKTKYALSEREYFAPSKMVSFSIDGHKHALIIPCLEVFSRLYGHSNHVKKSLINYPLRLSEQSLIYEDHHPQAEGTWLVTVTRHCTNQDAVYLAHLKHDAITRKRTNEIWHSMQYTAVNSSDKTCFPSVPPWFSGAVQIKVKGIWLDRDKTRFLGLQILGCSNPTGPKILLDRENTNLSEVRTRSDSKSVIHKRTSEGFSDILLSSDHEPGRNQESVEIDNPELEVIGEQREIERVVRDHKESGTLLILKTDEEITHHSGGDEYGSKLHVQRTIINTPVATIPPTFINVWHALNKLVSVKAIDSVMCVDIQGNQIGSTQTPGMISLPTGGLVNIKAKDRELLNWAMLEDNFGVKTPRRILLSKISQVNDECYLVEIERRISRRGNTPGSESDSYKGLAVKFQSGQDKAAWFNNLLIEIVASKGVFDKADIISGGSLISATFKHCGENKQDMERSVRNGLEKIGFL